MTIPHGCVSPARLQRGQPRGRAGMAWAAGIALCAACSSGGDGPSGPAGDLSGAISDNHGHTVTITAAQVAAGADVLLTSGGAATHTHTASLQSAQVVAIRAGTRTVVTSSLANSHSHSVTFR